MSFMKTFSLWGVVLASMAASSFAFAQNSPIQESRDDLALRMKQEGARKKLDPSDRHDLGDILHHAQGAAESLNLDCQSEDLFEVRLTHDENPYIAGYQVVVFCADAPSPALGLYYDIDHVFLKAFDLSN